MRTYQEFLKDKRIVVKPCGFEPTDLNPMLFGFQLDIVKWACRKGKACVFADCGMGKGPMALEWATQVCKSVSGGGTVLIVAPLAVSAQFVREGRKFGVDVNKCRDATDIVDGINVTNYERLHLFDGVSVDGVVLDESSILKSYSGKTRNQIIGMFKDVRYKLACTATPAPNDYEELGNHAEFVGAMTRTEMLAMFFTHDGGNTSKWRVKGHAVDKLWDWVAQWAVVVTKPSDLGYDDGGFKLPDLNIETIVVDSEKPIDDTRLFAVEALTLTDQRDARRSTMELKADRIAQRVNSDDGQWLVWCDLNAESKYLSDAIPDAVEVRGSDTDDHKEAALMGFADGSIRVLVTKPSIAGFGMNFQLCHQQAFCGLSHSYEQFYQSVRRSWRYGQEHPVTVEVVVSDQETAIVSNVLRKSDATEEMKHQMTKRSMRIREDLSMTQRDDMPYVEDDASGEGWDLKMGDCVERIREIPDGSIGYSIFSPPFASLYTYTNSDRDMGNSSTDSEFAEHFAYLVQELYRVIMPGRLVSFHCMDMPMMKERDGLIGMKDFSGELIRLFIDAGFIYHSRVTIWKDPVTEMQRTKALGLLNKQKNKDSSMSRQGMPDYLITVRKPGDNPEPITHSNEEFSIETWQRIASPVWMDINQSDTLQYRSARDNEDERHICLARGSLVLTKERGYVPIQDVEIGEHTLTHKGRWMPIVAKKMTSAEAEVIKVKAQGVPGLICTPNHKLWTRVPTSRKEEKSSAEKSIPKWVRADETLRSYLNLKTSDTTIDGGHDYELWWTVGRWISDGHWGPHGEALLSIGEKKWDTYVEKAGRFAGNQPHKIDAWQVYLKDADHKLRDILKECGNHADRKKLPPIAYQLDKYDATALLDGYLSGDGHLVHVRNTWQMTTVSYELALGIAYLAQRVWSVSPSVHAGRPERESEILGRKVHCKQEWNVSFCDQRAKRRISPFILDDGCWKKVRSIEDAGTAEVWNIEVAEDHSYTAEGCIVKNCPLQLPVIDRGLMLWSNPGDTVLSPFAGIGSEGYQSVKRGRKFIGIELKPSYFNAAVTNLRNAEMEASQQTLFDFMNANSCVE